jgi:hypothetical protein
MPSARPGGAILDNQTAWMMISTITGMEHFVDRHNRSERWTAYRYGVDLAWIIMLSEQL